MRVCECACVSVSVHVHVVSVCVVKGYHCEGVEVLCLDAVELQFDRARYRVWVKGEG